MGNNRYGISLSKVIREIENEKVNFEKRLWEQEIAPSNTSRSKPLNIIQNFTEEQKQLLSMSPAPNTVSDDTVDTIDTIDTLALWNKSVAPLVKNKKETLLDSPNSEKSNVEIPSSDFTDDKERVPDIEKTDKDTHSTKDVPNTTNEKSTKPGNYEIAQYFLKTKNVVRISGIPCCYSPMYRTYFPLKGEAGKTILRKELPTEYKKIIDGRKLGEIQAWLAVEESIPEIDFFSLNRIRSVVNFKNYPINIQTGQPCYGGEEFYFERYIHVDFPVDYEPCGTYFNYFLETSLGGNPDRIRTLQQAFGLAISDIRTNKICYIFKGSADSGKSVACNILRKLTGEDYTAALPFNELGARFSTAELYNRWLNIGSEIDTNSTVSSDVFKRLTGNDLIKAEEKYSHPFKFQNRALMIFPCNNYPRFSKSEDPQSIDRRIIIIPFHRDSNIEIKEDLEEKLERELDFIAKWALEGLADVINNGFVFCEDSEREKSQFLAEAFPFYIFQKEYLEEDPDSAIASAQLDDTYHVFCEKYRIPIPQRILWYKNLSPFFPLHEIRGIQYQGKSCRGYSGIRFNDAIETGGYS